MSDCHTVGPSSPAKGPSSPAAGGRVLRPMGPSSPADRAEFSGGRVLRGAEFSGADFSVGPTSPDTLPSVVEDIKTISKLWEMSTRWHMMSEKQLSILAWGGKLRQRKSTNINQDICMHISRSTGPTHAK